jgi:formylglycine-generating enzyme required for sulfatase activity
LASRRFEVEPAQGALGNSRRVNRGGGWNNNDASRVRAANRNRDAPANRNNNLGFRCAKTVEHLARQGVPSRAVSATTRA